MLKTLFGVVAVCTIMLSMEAANASAITGVAPSTNAGAGPDVNGSFLPLGPPAIDGPGGTVALSMGALAKGPRSFNFGVSTDASGVARVFTFTYTLVNSVGTGAESPLQPSAAGDDIGPIDLEIVSALGSAPTFVPGSASGTSGGLFAQGNLISPTHLRIGGLNGGGFAIPNGGTGVLTFAVALPPGQFGFNIRTTANPEPTSLALAGIGMCLFGGGGYYRRRKRNQQLSEPALDTPTS